MARPRKRFRTDAGVRDKFNLSNDHFYEISKDTRHRVRQTFGQLSVEHAYPAQKLQLPFVSDQSSFMSWLLILYSTKLACPKQKPVLSIVPRFNSPRILSCDSAKFGLQKRRRTKPVEGWGKVAM